MRPPHAKRPRRSLRSIIVSRGLVTLSCLIAVSVAGAARSGVADPSFAPGPSLPVGATPSAVAVGDFDSNGSTDLAVANYGYKSNLRILLNDGSGHFDLAPGSPFKVGSEPTSIAKADYNGDGKLDLAVAGENIRILIGHGTGRFSAAPGSRLAPDERRERLCARDRRPER